MNTAPPDLDTLGRRLTETLIQCLSDMVGLDLEPSQIVPDDEQASRLIPMMVMVDSVGTTTGTLVVSTQQATLSEIIQAAGQSVPDTRDEARELFENLLMEALNAASGDCLAELQDAEGAFITVPAPKTDPRRTPVPQARPTDFLDSDSLRWIPGDDRSAHHATPDTRGA